MRFTGILFVDLLLTIVFALVVMIGFNLLNIYYLKDLKINPWIPFAGGLVFFILALVLLNMLPKTLWYGIPLTIGLFLLLWFIDAYRKEKARKKIQSKERQYVRKPKPNPNRAKRLKEQDPNRK